MGKSPGGGGAVQRTDMNPLGRHLRVSGCEPQQRLWEGREVEWSPLVENFGSFEFDFVTIYKDVVCQGSE